MTLDTPRKLSPNTLVLHRVVGILMIGLLGTGLYMEQNEFYALYPWHKAFGVLVALAVLGRIAWRIRNGWPTSVGNYTMAEKLLSKSVHFLLLVGSVVMPLSGFLMSAQGGQGVDFFGVELVARNPDPVNPQEVVAHNAILAKSAHEVHGLAGYALIAGVVLHVLGAFEHHIVDNDGTLRRMLGAGV